MKYFSYTFFHKIKQNILNKIKKNISRDESGFSNYCNNKTYHLLFNNSISAIAVYKVLNQGRTGRDYIILDFNKKALELEKKELKDVLGRSLFDLRPNIDDCGLINVFKSVWETGVPAVYPVRFYSDDWYSNYYENNIFRISSNIITAVYNDVTERENNLIKLKKSEWRFDYAMDASGDGLFDWDLIKNNIFYSPGWKKMLGYDVDELPDDFSVWEDLTHPDDIEKAWKRQNELINKQRERFVLEFRMKHKDGYWLDILSRANAVFDDKGKAVRIIGVHTDITEQKALNRELEEKNTELKSLYAKSEKQKKAYLIVLKDLQEAVKNLSVEKEEKAKAYSLIELKEKMMIQTSRLASVAGWEYYPETDTLEWTDAVQDVFGFNSSYLNNLNSFLNIFAEDSRKQFLMFYDYSVREGKGFDIELRIRSSKRGVIWVRIYGEPYFNREKKVSRIMGALQDINLKKETEVILSENYERFKKLYVQLQDARENQSKHIAREIHDDLGQTLTSLEMLLTLLEDEINDAGIGEKGLLDIINELREQVDLSVEKARNLTLDLRPPVLDDGDLSSSLKWLIKHMIFNPGIKVETDISDEIVILDEGRRLSIFRVVQEALSNILKHSNADTVIINLHQKYGVLYLFIKDNGRGMKMVKNSINKGFGLIHMKERVESCNGKIDIESEEGAGTSIIIKIPLGVDP